MKPLHLGPTLMRPEAGTLMGVFSGGWGVRHLIHRPIETVGSSFMLTRAQHVDDVTPFERLTAKWWSLLALVYLQAPAYPIIARR